MCKQYLPATEKYYNKSKQSRMDLHNYCKKCLSDRHQRKAYGWTSKQRNEQYVLQDGRCAMCKRAVALTRIHTDHNHNTKKIRGLLCISCNTLVGYIEKSPRRVELAQRYIKEHKE